MDIYEAFLVKTLLFHLCGLTLDRYVALFFALRYETIATHTNVRRFVVISWIAPFIASAVQLTWLHKVMSESSSGLTVELICSITIIDFWFSLTSFLLFLALPMILLAIAFMSMLIEILRIIRSTPGADRLGRVSSKEKRAIYMFSLMYVTFLLLAMPYYTVRLGIDIHHYRYGVVPKILSPTMMRAVVGLKYSTSIIRPLLYGRTSSELRRVSRKLRYKLMPCKVHQDTSREMDQSDTSFLASTDGNWKDSYRRASVGCYPKAYMESYQKRRNCKEDDRAMVSISFSHRQEETQKENRNTRSETFG